MADIPETLSPASLSAEGLRQFSVYCQGFSCQLSIFSEPLQDALFSTFSADSVRHLEREREENCLQGKSQTRRKLSGIGHIL